MIVPEILGAIFYIKKAEENSSAGFLIGDSRRLFLIAVTINRLFALIVSKACATTCTVTALYNFI
jgi:hypothetical protein